MNNLVRYKASLRIGDDQLDPQEITKILGVEPDNAHRKGDPNTGRSKKGKLLVYSPFRSGLWSICSKEPEHMDLEHHLKSLLHTLYPLKDKLIELSNRGYKMDMFCGIFIDSGAQPGFDIDSNVLLKLGELNISFGLCIYCSMLR